VTARHLKPEDPARLRDSWRAEIQRARNARADQRPIDEWHHLERAHILSQPLAIPHVRTHAHMLGHALRHRDRRELIGQLLRILAAAPGSAAGRYPLGNTGGADVSAFEPMPVPSDLVPLLGPTSE